MTEPIRVTVWNEGRVEQRQAQARMAYPESIHAAVAQPLRAAGMQVRTATIDEPEQGLSEKSLAETDVLVWWGHVAHREIEDQTVDRLQQRVLDGMGLVVLHSGHESRIFQRLMGTTCNLTWREAGEKVRVWVVAPSHPIAAGLPEYFEIPHDEMYGEPFNIPTPDALVFVSWFEGGEIFRSGCAFERGRGRIFYFSAGHQTYPIYYQPEVQQVIVNAVRWATPLGWPAVPIPTPRTERRHRATPLEPIRR